MNIKLLISLVFFVGGAAFAGKIYAQQIQPDKIRGNAGDLPLIENPEPRLKANSTVPDSQLLPIDKLRDISKLPEGARLVNVQKKSWGVLENEKGGSRFHDVAPGRQVYEQVIFYPLLNHPDVGRVENATVTHVFDAATGDFIFEEVAGKFLDRVGPPRLSAEEELQKTKETVKAYCDAGVEVMCQQLQQYK